MKNQIKINNFSELSERQSRLLLSLVKRYITSAQPVSSQELVGQGLLDCSSATVRNDLAVLEELGYVHQPHTSAGRIPTESGYGFYVNYLQQGKLTNEQWLSNLQKEIAITHQSPVSEILKVYARKGSATIGSAVYVAFDEHDYYYTGLSSLFNQPEFNHIELVCSMAQVLDGLDRMVSNLWPRINDLQVEIGANCSFGRQFATVVGRTSSGALFGVLGPQRLDYERALTLINFLHNHI